MLKHGISRYMDTYLPTWMEIDLKAIRHNLLQIRKLVGNDVSILAPVKANAYGHGILEISRVFADMGVDYLGVGTIDEALLLRRNGFKKMPILMLGSILPEAIDTIIKNNITQTIGDIDLASQINKHARVLNKKAKVHVKIDTGMGRIGIWHQHALEYIDSLKDMDNLDMQGIFSHLSSADENSVETRKQIKDFLDLVEEIDLKKINIPLRHIANSIAALNYKDSHMNLIRPGIMLYGILPKKGLKARGLSLKPAMSVKSRIVFLKDISPGRSIGYGRTHIIKRHTRIATIPIGYGDGLSRSLSNKGFVLIRGKKAPIVGRICMDQIMADVGNIVDAGLGDEVVVMGKQGGIEINAHEIACLCDTIPYEIICCFDKRIPKIYKN
jgi:alanine racemase